MDRARVVKEIAVNAAEIFGCQPGDVAVAVMAVEGAYEARATAGEKTLRETGPSETAALWGLLQRAIDGALGGPGTQTLVMTPSLEKAIRLLQLSRLELIAEIRKEVDENPVLADESV